MYKVLIVEDDPMVAMINEQYIGKNKNFQVIGKCRDGKEALHFLEATVEDDSSWEADLSPDEIFVDGVDIIAKIEKET